MGASFRNLSQACINETVEAGMPHTALHTFAGQLLCSNGACGGLRREVYCPTNNCGSTQIQKSKVKSPQHLGTSSYQNTKMQAANNVARGLDGAGPWGRATISDKVMSRQATRPSGQQAIRPMGTQASHQAVRRVDEQAIRFRTCSALSFLTITISQAPVVNLELRLPLCILAMRSMCSTISYACQCVHSPVQRPI